VTVPDAANTTHFATRNHAVAAGRHAAVTAMSSAR
jgi:hypothetical protein